MKHVLTILFLLAAMSAYSQTTASAKGSIGDNSNVLGTTQVATTQYVPTAADSTVIPIPISPTVAADLDQIDAKIKEIAEQYNALVSQKNTSVDIQYKIYCDQHGIDRSKVKLKELSNHQIKIQVSKK